MDATNNVPGDADLITYLCQTQALSSVQAEHIVAEVLAYYREGIDHFVQRRHRELQAQGMGNNAVFETIAAELQNRLFPASPLSQRQIRRIIYG